MPAGDLVVAEWQFEYRGVLFDRAEGYWVDVVDGLDSLPETRRAKIPRPRASGSLVTPNYSDERTIVLEMRVHGSTHEQYRERIDALVAATDLIDTPVEFVYRMGGQADKRLVFCRPDGRTIPGSKETRLKAGRAVLRFVAEDNLVYLAELNTETTGVGSTVGGMEYPIVYPLTYGVATPGTITAVNDGLAEAPWTATLTGPLVSPKILHVAKQEALELNGFNLEAGQTLEFDQQARTVELNGTASRSGSLTRRDWFTLSPGTNVIQLDASSGGGNLSFSWRSASN